MAAVAVDNDACACEHTPHAPGYARVISAFTYVPVSFSSPAGSTSEKEKEKKGVYIQNFRFLKAMGTPTPKLVLFYPKLPPIGPAGFDGTVHQGSYCKYQEAIKRAQLKKYANQQYRVPLTCGQDIGWWLPMDLSVKPEDAIPWIRVQRHPQVRSPMTKFIDSMAISNPLFSLF
ncbi:sperm microtubule inner protein 11 [Elgaria multicarinata webbii]|uniref:sperm microtubule inner protein 11 n=1 Tax=Elgaria multicarinata webbii TaxID=159646 RepID=UPI002FCCF508